MCRSGGWENENKVQMSHTGENTVWKGFMRQGCGTERSSEEEGQGKPCGRNPGLLTCEGWKREGQGNAFDSLLCATHFLYNALFNYHRSNSSELPGQEPS